MIMTLIWAMLLICGIVLAISAINLGEYLARKLYCKKTGGHDYTFDYDFSARNAHFQCTKCKCRARTEQYHEFIAFKYPLRRPLPVRAHVVFLDDSEIN